MDRPPAASSGICKIASNEVFVPPSVQRPDALELGDVKHVHDAA